MVEILKNYINGDWVESNSTQLQEVINPATLELLAKVPRTTKEEVEAAIKTAKNAFWEWRCTPPPVRANYLLEFRACLVKHFEEIAQIVVKENGKTLDEARGDVKRGIEAVDFSAGVMTHMMGGIEEDVAKDIDESFVKEPLGVCAGLTPYNFPAMIPLWFLPNAIACGNTFILKPASSVPLTAKAIVEAAEEVGFPAGVVNLIFGGREVTDTLLISKDVEAVSFVGSSEVAASIYNKAAQTKKRASCQGQAKNFIVIMPDANLDAAIPALITSAYGCAGQRCLAGEIFIAVGDVYEPLKKKFIEASKRLTMGYGLDTDAQIGPLSNKDIYAQVIRYIEIGLKEGATLALDGRGNKPIKYPNGYFIGPTVFENVQQNMKIYNEEIFGPVICLTKANTLNEAISMVNSSKYGNASAIFTSNGKNAREFTYKVEAGNIGINIGVPAPVFFFPFSSWKGSMYGDLHAQAGEIINFYTQNKTIITRWL
jgi:malonate-semialdehyde dehydrogenase (acetylating)/methylmalonate-semialdehyde dehydrogenase